MIKNNEELRPLIEAVLSAGKAILNIYRSADFGVETKKDESPLTLADKAAHNVLVSYLNQTEFPVISEEGVHLSREIRQYYKTYWLIDPLDGTKEFIKKNDEFTVNVALIHQGKPVFGLVYAPVLKELFIGLEKEAYKLNNENIEELRTPLKNENQIQVKDKKEKDKTLIVVASRSHFSPETKAYIDALEEKGFNIELISKGSSLKICLVAEGKADVYPRFDPTMEWDTAAAHAVLLAAGGQMINPNTNKELVYNKEELLNPFFIAGKKGN
jgi:3'(2'), 5'-bisphosphate nucleotidase